MKLTPDLCDEYPHQLQVMQPILVILAAEKSLRSGHHGELSRG